jgi:hypothetical protein
MTTPCSASGPDPSGGAAAAHLEPLLGLMGHRGAGRGVRDRLTGLAVTSPSTALPGALLDGHPGTGRQDPGELGRLARVAEAVRLREFLLAEHLRRPDEIEQAMGLQLRGLLGQLDSVCTLLTELERAGVADQPGRYPEQPVPQGGDHALAAADAVAEQPGARVGRGELVQPAGDAGREQRTPHPHCEAATVALGVDHHRLVLRFYSAQPGWRRGCRGERDRLYDHLLPKHGDGSVDLIAAAWTPRGPR